MNVPESRNCPTFLNVSQVGFQRNIWSGGLWDKFTWKSLLMLEHKLGCIVDLYGWKSKMLNNFKGKSFVSNFKICPVVKVSDTSPYENRDSDWLRAGRPKGWSSSTGRVKNFLFSTSSRPALGSIQPIQWVPGSLSAGVKRPRRETDNSLPTSAEVKKMWNYTSTLPYMFMA
jgi:hypothetical protein